MMLCTLVLYSFYCLNIVHYMLKMYAKIHLSIHLMMGIFVLFLGFFFGIYE